MFKKVILYARLHRANHEVNETLKHLVTYLNKNNIPTYQDEETQQSFNLQLPSILVKDIQKDDLILVVGGDGSLLSAARLAIKVNVAVLGINRGRLGFLTDISPHDLKNELDKIFQGEFITEQRFLLQMNIEGEQKYQELALNDVVVSRGEENYLVAFDVYINSQFVNHYRADGLILTTPTGSTAYALSAGGPIMHPGLNAIALVPMFAHTLSARPLVVSADDVIEIEVSKENDCNLEISCDGHVSHLLHPGQRVKIQKDKRLLKLLHPLNYHYYDTLRIKLGWGRKNCG